MASGGLSFSLIENFPVPAKSLVGLAISLTPHVISTGCLHPASFQKLAKGMHCEFVRGKFFAIHAPCSLSQGVDSSNWSSVTRVERIHFFCKSLCFLRILPAFRTNEASQLKVPHFRSRSTGRPSVLNLKGVTPSVQGLALSLVRKCTVPCCLTSFAHLLRKHRRKEAAWLRDLYLSLLLANHQKGPWVHDHKSKSKTCRKLRSSGGLQLGCHLETFLMKFSGFFCWLNTYYVFYNVLTWFYSHEPLKHVLMESSCF